MLALLWGNKRLLNLMFSMLKIGKNKNKNKNPVGIVILNIKDDRGLNIISKEVNTSVSASNGITLINSLAARLV